MCTDTNTVIKKQLTLHSIQTMFSSNTIPNSRKCWILVAIDLSMCCCNSLLYLRNITFVLYSQSLFHVVELEDPLNNENENTFSLCFM